MNGSRFKHCGRSLLMAIALGLAGTAGAHDDAFFDSHASPHGGQVRMSGPYHLELLRAPSGLLVYVTDHGDTKIPTRGWQARAIVLGGGKKQHVALKPAGDNTLRGNGAVIGDAKVVVTVQPATGETYNARFTLDAAPPAAAGK